MRTHVRRVLEKVQARGQADPIRMLLAGPTALLIRSFKGDDETEEPPSRHSPYSPRHPRSSRSVSAQPMHASVIDTP